MREVKLTKRMLQMGPASLLVTLGAVNLSSQKTYPSTVYVSKEDYKKLISNTRKIFKKDYPYLSKRKLETAVEMHLFNYGPNTSLAKAIRPGYALVKYERNPYEG